MWSERFFKMVSDQRWMDITYVTSYFMSNRKKLFADFQSKAMPAWQTAENLVNVLSTLAQYYKYGNMTELQIWLFGWFCVFYTHYNLLTVEQPCFFTVCQAECSPWVPVGDGGCVCVCVCVQGDFSSSLNSILVKK